MPHSATVASPYNQQALLRVYAYYRVVLALLLLAMFYTTLTPLFSVLGDRQPVLFQFVINLYVFSVLATLARLHLKKFITFDQHIFLACFNDITCLTLLMHASGGVESGLGLLLLITVSAAGILMSVQIATLIAALATLALLTSAIFNLLYGKSEINILLPAGLLGFLLFVTSQLFVYLTQRIRLTTEEAETQNRQRAEAQQLNEMIVRRMRTGLVVLAPNGQIRLMNESAARLLDMHLTIDSTSALDISFAEIPALYESFQQWRSAPQLRSKPVRLREGGPELQLSFAGLEQNEHSDILVFVEDLREVAQQAQQLKLASLGHLSANIAHEVRNPLGAISHAAQLLNESQHLEQHDRRLSEIIQTHSRRVNQVIENVLQISRRRNPQPEKKLLASLLDEFIQHYRQTHRGDVQLELRCEASDLIVNIDHSQLEQVLNNLCDNGLRYSLQHTGIAHLLLHAYQDPSQGIPRLDIIDDGPGVPLDEVNRIFEPFFTTENQGTGLGLYLAKEICEANQAQLSYERTAEGKSCFRISFPHPDKTITPSIAP